MDTVEESQGIPDPYQEHVPHYPEVCTRCNREFSTDNDATGSLCGYCKSLLVEGLENPVRGSNRRRTSRGRRIRHSSSESIEDLSSHHFSRMINLTRQNQPALENEDRFVGGDVSARFVWHNSSLSTPSGSRRWHRVPSDSESDGFDYMENESNFSFGHLRPFHGESDAISFSAYGGDSDISVDGRSFLDTDLFAQTNEESDLYSESDIDPMHAGINQWDFDDEEDSEEEDDDGDSGSTDAEVDAAASREDSRLGIISAQNEIRASDDQGQTSMYPGLQLFVNWRSREGMRRNTLDIYGTLFEDLPSHSGNSRDYLDERGFEELLEHLAETDSSRRGAPPASVSYVNSLPIITIAKEHLRHDGIVCAICKDVLTVGTEANQLPCLHLYHPPCILPWLSSRNSCPLCRYELPTDDKDYEERKRSRNVVHMHENGQQRVVAHSSVDAIEEAEEPELMLGVGEQRDVQDGNHSISSTHEVHSRGRWFYMAAAPIVSLMGLALVLWLGNPLVQRSTAVTVDHHNIPTGVGHQAHVHGMSSSNRENRRRWWSFFLGR